LQIETNPKSRLNPDKSNSSVFQIFYLLF